MGRRTLTAWELTFHQKFVRNPGSFAPSDLDGEDLLDVFEGWASRLTTDDTKDEKRQNWLAVSRVDRIAPRVVLLEMSVGAYGEPGAVVESKSGRSVFTVTEEHAPTGQVRSILMVPEVGLKAYYLAEYSTRGTGGSRVLGLFHSHFRQHSGTITMEQESVSESEAWSSDAALKEVEVRLKGQSADVADGEHVEIGTLSHVARASRGHVFSRGLMQRLTSDRGVAGQVVGVPGVGDDAEVYVTMQLDGRQKKFLLGTGGAPTLRQVLNDAAELPLTDAELLRVCQERVSDLAGRTGGTWNPAWSTP